MPKISVIVPIYNVESYLDACMQSLVDQTYDDYEIVAVDDGSTDSSRSIAEKYAQKYPFVRVIPQENKGLGGARNTGLLNSNGEYVCFIDSDDYLEKDTLAVLADNVEKNNADIVMFDFEFVDTEGHSLSVQKMFNDPIEGVFSLSSRKDLLLASPSACNKLFRKSLFTDNEIFFPDRVWYEDVRTILKLYLYADNLCYVQRPFYKYVQRPGSIMNNAKLERNIEIIDAMDDVFTYYKEKNAYETYRNELDFLVILNVFVLASFRVLKYDSKHRLLSDFYDYLNKNVPNYGQNPYLQTHLGKKNYVIYTMLCKKQYKLLQNMTKVQTWLRKMK